MDAKLSVVLNLTRFEHDEFIFINQLKKQSLQEIQIVVISDIDDKTLEDKCLKLYSDDSRISFYRQYPKSQQFESLAAIVFLID